MPSSLSEQAVSSSLQGVFKDQLLITEIPRFNLIKSRCYQHVRESILRLAYFTLRQHEHLLCVGPCAMAGWVAHREVKMII